MYKTRTLSDVEGRDYLDSIKILEHKTDKEAKR